jgi:hypothetical protein
MTGMIGARFSGEHALVTAIALAIAGGLAAA